MFVFSVKTSKRQLISSLVCVGLVVVIAAAAILLPPSAEPTAAQRISLEAEDEEDRLALLKNLGFETEEQSAQVQEIRIPDEMDEALSSYNALQKQAGLDLEPYLGKRIKVYTYRILNSDDPRLTRANLYVYRDKVVAGDLSSEDATVPMRPLFTAK